MELELAQLDKCMEYPQDIFPLSGAINLYHSLGIFSRRQIDDTFLIFPKKEDLTFHANLETICMQCHIQFSGKNKKNISKCRLL